MSAIGVTRANAKHSSLRFIRSLLSDEGGCVEVIDVHRTGWMTGRGHSVRTMIRRIETVTGAVARKCSTLRTQ
jgi:hypothetical protein